MDCLREPEVLVFDSNIVENWKKFKKQFLNYLFEASTRKKCNFFFNLVSDDGFELFESLNIEISKKEKFGEVLKAYMRHIACQK